MATKRARNLMAAGAMLATSGIVAAEAIGSFTRAPLAFAGVLALAGFGMTRRSLVAQVLSRSAAWLVLLPSLVVSGASFLHGSIPPIEVLGLAASTGAALALTRPMLHDDEARAAFAPKAYRSWFLAGSTASSAVAIIAGGISMVALGREPAMGLAFGALSLSLLASAIGVLRMRSWGVLLGAATSLALLFAAAFVPREPRGALMLAAAPPLLFHLLPVLFARWLGTAPEARVAEHVEPVRYRIAAASGREEDAQEEELETATEERSLAMRA